MNDTSRLVNPIHVDQDVGTQQSILGVKCASRADVRQSNGGFRDVQRLSKVATLLKKAKLGCLIVKIHISPVAFRDLNLLDPPVTRLKSPLKQFKLSTRV